MPGNGLIVANGKDSNIERLLQRGVWTPLATFSAQRPRCTLVRQLRLRRRGVALQRFRAGSRAWAGRWSLLGQHNLENALAAIAAAEHVGVTAGRRCKRSREFKGVKRRLELRGTFARHRPVRGFRASSDRDRDDARGLASRAPGQRIVAVMEPRSNTMRMGVHRDTLHGSFADADRVFVLGAADLGWDPAAALAPLGARLVAGPTCRPCSRDCSQSSSPAIKSC